MRCQSILIYFILLFFVHCKEINSLFEEKNKPDISNPKTLRQDIFEVKYPSNWDYQEDLENYSNLDFKSYLIESPGNSYVQFIAYNTAIENESCVEEFKSEFEDDIIEIETTEEKDSWGKQRGYGIKLAGKILLQSQGSINIFCFTENENTISVIEFYYESDFENIKTGLFLVQSSFKLF